MSLLNIYRFVCKNPPKITGNVLKTLAMCNNHNIQRENGDPRKDQTRGDSPKFTINLCVNLCFSHWSLLFSEIMADFMFVKTECETVDVKEEHEEEDLLMITTVKILK